MHAQMKKKLYPFDSSKTKPTIHNPEPLEYYIFFGEGGLRYFVTFLTAFFYSIDCIVRTLSFTINVFHFISSHQFDKTGLRGVYS